VFPIMSRDLPGAGVLQTYNPIIARYETSASVELSSGPDVFGRRLIRYVPFKQRASTCIPNAEISMSFS
jgi:hypothetical protein